MPPQAIKRLARAEAIDVAKLKAETDLVGYPIVGVVHQLAKQCGDAGRYVHWGATTQDIMDTATVLQMRDALALVEADLAAIDAALAALARKHRDTVMAGRTHLQHALPVTFGYKAAVWLGMIVRHRERLAQLQPARPGRPVRRRGGHARLARRQGPRRARRADGRSSASAARPSPGTWRATASRRPCRFLGLVTGTLAKIATDVMLMMQTEVGEAFEPFSAGPRLLLDHAAEAQSDLVRVHPRRRQGGAPAGRPDARRHGRRPRARHRSLAARVGGGAGGLHRDGRARCGRRGSCSRA